MKIISITNIIPYVLAIGMLFSGCIKEEEPIAPVVITEASHVNLFIWNGMNEYYLWNDKVPGLSNTSYSKGDSLNSFLNKYSDPEDLFYDLLYRADTIDKWSFIVDDSKQIDDWISGISETMGYDFMLGRIEKSNILFGFVRYIYKGSPAEKSGLKRGDIFYKVNDQQITVNNYPTLLFATPAYELSFATVIDTDTGYKITPIDKAMNMAAIEMQENPICLDTVFTFNNQKIGYLVYNGFNAEFDLQLNDVIQKFKDATIDQMVLDLRYNGGGSVQSSIYLASMLFGTDESKLFAKAQFNQGFQASIISTEGAQVFNDNFTRTIKATATTPATPINTLNLQKIYIIVSDNTASASELLINGLRPYMEVKVVGINTYGKYVGSFTITDDKVTSNKWAMQPIVVKYANSLGETDFVNGLTPNIRAEEDIANLLPFGDSNETLLKAVLDDMQGMAVTASTLKSAKMGLRKVADSQDFQRFSRDMYVNPEKFKSLNKADQEGRGGSSASKPVY